MRFKCKQCDDDEPLKLVPNDGIGLCSTCTTILPAGMVAGGANCKAVVCLACIDNGERLLDLLELLEQAEAAMPTTAAGSQEEALAVKKGAAATLRL